MVSAASRGVPSLGTGPTGVGLGVGVAVSVGAAGVGLVVICGAGDGVGRGAAFGGSAGAAVSAPVDGDRTEPPTGSAGVITAQAARARDASSSQTATRRELIPQRDGTWRAAPDAESGTAGPEVAERSGRLVLPALVSPSATIAREHVVGWRLTLLSPVRLMVLGRLLVVRSVPQQEADVEVHRPVARTLLVPVGVAGFVVRVRLPRNLPRPVIGIRS